MASESTLRGYLLEEALAWLLRHTGYRLLVHNSQDMAELTQGGNGLQVRGRGADHQVDVLGEFAFPPAFSLPIRLFLEAKFTRRRADLKALRNAHGVIDDINENFARRPDSQFSRRFRYVYALFSASGFTSDAETYALAQQISLVDLSIEAYGWLRQAVETAASALYPLQEAHDVGVFPVNWMRGQLRDRFDTLPKPTPADFSLPGTNAAEFAREASPILGQFTKQVMRDETDELLLGFPAAPFILPIVARDARAFLNFARNHRSHEIQLHWTRSEWQASPSPSLAGDISDSPISGQEYQLKFSLPEAFKEWIREHNDRIEERAGDKARKFLMNIVIYHMEKGSDVLETLQLRYNSDDMHR